MSLSARAPAPLPWWRSVDACQRALLLVLDLFWARSFEKLTRCSWGDSLYAILEFYLYHGFFGRFGKPRSFSENMLRLKLKELNDPLRRRVTDKEHLRAYVREVAGDRYNVPSLAVLRSPAEVAAFAFPPCCVIKPSHSSGKHIVRRAASEPVMLETVNGWFSHHYYPRKREANYRGLVPKVIVEEMLFFDGRLADDYKVHCFFGRPKLIHVMRNRFTGVVAGAMFTPDWQELPFTIQRYRGAQVSRPANLEDIITLAERLSAPFSYMRVDLYTDGRHVYVGELTNLPGGATLTFEPFLADQLTGKFFEDPDLDPVEVYAALRVT